MTDLNKFDKKTDEPLLCLVIKLQLLHSINFSQL